MQVSFPDPTAPNVGGVPQSHNLFHPHLSNHANVAAMSDTFKIGVRPLASIISQGYQTCTADLSSLMSLLGPDSLQPLPKIFFPAFRQHPSFQCPPEDCHIGAAVSFTGVQAN